MKLLGTIAISAYTHIRLELMKENIC